MKQVLHGQHRLALAFVIEDGNSHAAFSFPSLRSGKENPGEKKMLREAFLLVNLFLADPKGRLRKGLGASPLPFDFPLGKSLAH